MLTRVNLILKLAEAQNEIEQYKTAIKLQREYIKNTVLFPKLEKDNGHKGWWILYDLDENGNIWYSNFQASKKEAMLTLEQAKKDKKIKNEIKDIREIERTADKVAIKALEELKNDVTSRSMISREIAKKLIEDKIRELKGE